MKDVYVCPECGASFTGCEIFGSVVCPHCWYQFDAYEECYEDHSRYMDRDYVEGD